MQSHTFTAANGARHQAAGDQSRPDHTHLVVPLSPGRDAHIILQVAEESPFPDRLGDTRREPTLTEYFEIMQHLPQVERHES